MTKTKGGTMGGVSQRDLELAEKKHRFFQTIADELPKDGAEPYAEEVLAICDFVSGSFTLLHPASVVKLAEREHAALLYVRLGQRLMKIAGAQGVILELLDTLAEIVRSPDAIYDYDPIQIAYLFHTDEEPE